MAKTLTIKGADFSTNKVTTVSFGGGSVPCTGISLDVSTLSVQYGGTGTLTATVTPSNTTDTLTWSTSNNNVATVSEGVVTAVGVGSATITATCGNQTATCAVTVAMPSVSGLEIVGYRVNGDGVADSGNGLGYLASGSKHGAIAAESGTLPIYKTGSSYQTDVYPIPIPIGVSKIKITRANSNYYGVKVGFFNRNTNAGTLSPTSVKLLKKVEQAFSSDVLEVNVENYTGQPNTDGFIISIEKTSAFETADFDNITVEFVAE